MFREIRSFSDPQQHASSLLGWQQVYDQQSCGSFSSELRQVTADHFQIFQESLDKRIVQYGRSPKGRLCIALLMSADRSPLVLGQKVGAHNVVLLRDGEEFLLHSPEGLCFLGANVDLVRFAKLAALELSSDKLELLKSMPQLSLAEPVLQRVRQRIYPVFECLLQRREPVNAAVEKMLEDTLLDAFLDLFSHACEEGRDRRGSAAVCAYLVKRSQELAMEAGGRLADQHHRSVRTTARQPPYPAEQFPGDHRHAAGGVPAQLALERRAPASDRNLGKRVQGRGSGGAIGLLPPQPFCQPLPCAVRRIPIGNPPRRILKPQRPSLAPSSAEMAFAHCCRLSR